MFINMRYHIASLVAIFLALGLGMLIGLAMPWDQSLAERQQQLTSRLESQMELLKKKNDGLKAKINTLEMQASLQGKFEQQVLPVLVDGRLKGKNVAVIDLDGFTPPDQLISTMKAAGAEIQSVTLLGGLKTNHKTGSRPYPGGGEIARAIFTGDTAVTEVLADKSIGKTGVYGSRLTDVVLIGGGRGGGDNEMDREIIDYFMTKNIKVFGVEESSSPESRMKEYQDKKLTTVDNIDTVPGLLALVYAIEGRPGSYGIKSTAQKMLPDLDCGAAVNAR
jgi:hypothetical protein